MPPPLRPTPSKRSLDEASRNPGRRQAEKTVACATAFVPSRALPDSAKLHPGYGTYTLTPDYALIPVSVEHAKDAWWLGSDGKKVYVKTGNGKSAQWFNVK